MSKRLRNVVLGACCIALAASLPAVAQKPAAASASSCETLCFQRYSACINAGTSELICDRQLTACLDKCGI